MKLWKLATFCAASLLILSGCGGAIPKPADEIKIDKTLPIVKLTQNGTVEDMNAVAFEWKAIEDERVKGIYIYKQVVSEEAAELEHYKTINNRFTTHYLDRDIKPETTYNYSFKTFSKEAESPMSEVKVVNSLPVLQSVVWIQSIQNMPRTAKIIWRPHANQKVKSYIIERRTLEEDKWSKIATVDGRLNAEFIDVDLKDNFVYKYRVRVLTYDGIVSTPSEIVQVVTKALPISVKHIVATTDLPRKIEINWEKSTTEDFDRYYLYRSETSDGSYELIAKLYNNTFTDVIEEDGKEYFYRVSAVEKNGLESIHDKLSIQGITLIKPETPSLVEAKIAENKIEIKWNNKDPRVKTYTVVKKAKTGWFDAKDEEFVEIKGTKFLDSEIGPNVTYYYQVFAIDEFGIKSQPSIEVEIKTPNTVADNRKKEEEITEPNSKTQKKSEEVIIPTQDFN
ncbi:fibronectin type III domain-containing protein [Sulfurimonas sp.]|uniref:fibronectin type III domain-containing protein n=1 Tax=Sulfurimonas sp. TaxID=2022749 RepID=UPI0035670C77